jgi:hypothetical protein
MLFSAAAAVGVFGVVGGYDSFSGSPRHANHCMGCSMQGARGDGCTVERWSSRYNGA